LVWHLLFSRRYDDVISQGQRLLQDAPALTGVLAFLGLASSGRNAARRDCNVAESGGCRARRLFSVGGSQPCIRRRRSTHKAHAILEQLLARSQREFVSPEILANIYCGLNDRERAMDWLEKAYAARTPGLVYIAWMRCTILCARRREFQALLHKLQLPAN